MRPTLSTPVATLRVWDLAVRLFHWLLVASVAAAFLSAFEASPIAPWHQAAGWVAGVLVVFRLVWGFIGGRNARFGAFFHFDKLGDHIAQLLRGKAEPALGHNPLGALSILALLALTAVTVVTGAIVSGAAGEGPHEIFAYVLLALIAAHLGAVVLMSKLTGENLVRAMLTGRKSAALHPGASDAPRPSVAALLVGAAVIAATAYGVTRIDPLAFGPHASSERGEIAAEGPASDRNADPDER